MAIVDLVMPKLGESIMEATILKWHKKPGDTVQADETVLDIATDKVDSEVPSTAAGRIAEILFKENDVVPIGSVIAKIETDVSAGVETDNVIVPGPVGDVHNEAALEEEIDEQGIPFVPIHHAQAGNGASRMSRFYSPLVMNIANSEGISMTELEHIPGTGNEGRVTKKDILQYVQNRGSAPQVSRTNRETSGVNVRPQQRDVAIRQQQVEE